MKQFKCVVCGFIHRGSEPPERCPVCKASSEKFIEVEAEEQAASSPADKKAVSTARQFKCVVCGYIHAGDEPPERCPVCKAQREKFTPYFSEENEKGVVHGNVFDSLETAPEAAKKATHLKTEDMVLETYYFMPGQSIDYHKHPGGDQIFIVIQGRGEFYIDNGTEVKTMIGPGDYVLAPKNVWHKIVNTGANILILSQIIAQNAGIILKSSH